MIRGPIGQWEDLQLLEHLIKLNVKEATAQAQANRVILEAEMEKMKNWKSSFRMVRSLGVSGAKLIPRLFQESNGIQQLPNSKIFARHCYVEQA